MTLEKKIVPHRLYLSVSKSITLPEVSEFAALNIESLYDEAQKLDLKISGPCEFVYINCTGELDKCFDLKIVIPIEEKGNISDKFEYFESEEFTCISKEYIGNMDGIGGAWQSLMEDVQSNNITLSSNNHCREIYTQWLAYEHDDNIIELQTQTQI